MPSSNQPGLSWASPAEFAVGRGVFMDGRRGHIKTLPYRDPFHGMQQVCVVQWDDAPQQPEDMLTEVLKPYLQPYSVNTPVIARSKVLKPPKQTQAANNQAMNSHLAKVNEKQPAVTKKHLIFNDASQTLATSTKQHRPVNVPNASQADNSCEKNSVKQALEPTSSAGKKRRNRNACRRNKGAATQQPQMKTFDLTGLPDAWLICLVQQHLDTVDRLHMFRTSKALAAVIMHHTRRPTLSLTQRSGSTVGLNKITNILDLAKSLISAACDNLHMMVSRHALLYPISRMMYDVLPKHNVTKLTFDMMALEPEHLMQLKAFSKLSILVLGQHLRYHHTGNNQAVQLSDLDSWLPASCTKLWLFEEATHSCVLHLLPLLAPRITQLVIRPGGEAVSWHEELVIKQLPSFTALTHIACPWTLRPASPLLNALMSVSSLTHVVVDGLAGSRNADTNSLIGTEVPSGHQPLQWQQLVVHNGCFLEGLVQLPLHDIQHVVIDAVVYPWFTRAATITKQQMENLAKCPKLQLLPCIKFNFKGYRWQNDKELSIPEQLSLLFVAFNDDYTPAIAQACVRNLVGGLILPSICNSLFDCAVLANFLCHLPPTVDVLWFDWTRPAGNRAHSYKKLAATLPAHVKKVLLAYRGRM